MSRPRGRALLRAAGERTARLTSVPLGSAVGAAAIAAAIPRRFDPRQAADLDTTIELRLRTGDGRAARALALRIDHGRLSVSPGPASAPEAAAEISVDDVIRLAAGAAAWPQLLGGGRMALTGDPFLALRFPTLFRLPVD